MVAGSRISLLPTVEDPEGRREPTTNPAADLVVAAPADDRTPRRPGALVADDDPVLRHLLRQVLERAGFRVLVAADGLEALAAYRLYERQIDVVVSDVRMPGLVDGPGLLAALKALDPGVRLMFVTAFSGDHDHDELIAAGAARVLTKPFKIPDLIEAARALARSR